MNKFNKYFGILLTVLCFGLICYKVGYKAAEKEGWGPNGAYVSGYLKGYWKARGYIYDGNGIDISKYDYDVNKVTLKKIND